MKILFEKEFPGLKNPKRSFDLDSGWDLFSPFDFIIPAGEVITIKTGIKFQIKTPILFKIFSFFGAPIIVEAHVRPKSGMSAKGLEVSLGTIDNEYTGYVGITIYNRTEDTVRFSSGDKLAQLVFAPVFSGIKFQLKEGSVINTVTRGTGGFGSTGHK